MNALTRREAIQLTAAAIAGSLTLARPSRAGPSSIAGDDDPSIRRTSVDLPSGIRLHYAEMGEAEKPIIVCLHGYTDSWHSYRPVMPLLAQTHRVIAVDLRGHGDSSTPSGDFTFDAFATDVVALLMHLGIDRAAFIGHSMGSFVARRIAADHPDRVERLILVGAARTVDNSEVRGLRGEVHALGESIPREFVEGFQTGTLFDRRLVPEWFFNACVEASGRVQPRVWREAIDAMFNDQQALSDVNLTCPTLVIGGERDAVFSAQEQRALAQAISGSKLLLYRHCGHSPNWEQPLRFAEDVQTFLARGATIAEPMFKS